MIPWFSTARLKALRDDLVATVAEIRNGRLPRSAEPRPLPAAFQGLGLLLASFLAVTGLAMFFGMAADGAMRPVVGALKEAHEAAAPLMWAYLVIHPALGILHQRVGHHSLSRMFRVG
ncbi:cytochrome b/b6 domain-containing protein [Roseomonas genomospecies 6]|uniref:cytochrome b/b6 domain-containing protein n=1 Tax=Roseomonas genomospecies 6 TaxID=214106 RepID=UPI00142ED5DE|nr:cytochrome b/b6 domain-containing protein [Roseomonas genomospecies 6]